MKLLTLLLAVPAALALQKKESHEVMDNKCLDYLIDNCDTDNNWTINQEEAPCANSYLARNPYLRRWTHDEYLYSFCQY